MAEKNLPIDDGFRTWEDANYLLLRRLALIVLVFGLLYRVFRYALALPFYGDETMLMVNYLTRSYSDIFGPIDNCQIAPLLFHWAEIAVLQHLGPSEWSMRLPPLLASLTGLLLFWRLAREVLSPVGHLIAVSVLATSSFPVYTASIVKPYSCDLLASVTLLLFFAMYLNRRDQAWPLWCLAAAGAVVPFVSYPSIFVAGAIGPILLVLAWHSKHLRIIAPVLAFNLLAVAGFLIHYWFVGRVHLSSPVNSTTTQEGMDIFWRNANCFPPWNIFEFIVWAFCAFAGEICAHPIGSQRGGSIINLLIALFGLRLLHRQGRWALLMAFIGVFVLWFFAAALHKYPMGSGRLSQHTAPIVCLLIGLGGCALVQKTLEWDRRIRLVKRMTAAFVVLAVGGMAWCLMRPYYDYEARWSRQATRQVVDASGNDLLLVANAPENMLSTVRWNLLKPPAHVAWAERDDWGRLIGERRTVWIASFSPQQSQEEEELHHRLSRDGAVWTCEARLSSRMPPEQDGTPFHTSRAYRFVRSEEHVANR